MSSLNRFAGELTIDHTFSPGIPPELAAQVQARGGIAAAGSTKVEVATYTCAHCNAIVLMRPDRTRDRSVCRKCMRVVCDQHSLWCEPFARLADAVADGKFATVASSALLLPRPR